MCVLGGEEEEAGGEDPLLSATQLQSKRPSEQQRDRPVLEPSRTTSTNSDFLPPPLRRRRADPGPEAQVTFLFRTARLSAAK